MKTEHFIFNSRFLAAAELKQEITKQIGSAHPESAYYPAHALSTQALLDDFAQQSVFVMPTPAQQRRAYHSDSRCFGLASAQSEPQKTTVSALEGEEAHPPCALCRPHDWRVLTEWKARLSTFVADWNSEAEALRRYGDSLTELHQRSARMKDVSAHAFDSITSQAKQTLLGGRLRYQATGSRGFMAVVVDTAQRSLPDFTLPALTGAQGQKLSPQLALAGAKLMPSATRNTLPSILGQSDKAPSATSVGIAGATYRLLDESALSESGEVETLEGDSLATTVLTLWGSCLDCYVRGTTSLETGIGELPFGLGASLQPALAELLKTAQASPPDLSYPEPVLVNTSYIGNPHQEGFEGRLISGFRAAKKAGAQLQESGFLTILGDAENEWGETQQVSELFNLFSQNTILGAPLLLPFAQNTEDAWEWARKAFGEIGSLK